MAFFVAQPAFAGPPFATDDAEITARGDIEAYVVAEGIASDGTSEHYVGVDLSYGVTERLEIDGTIGLGREAGANRFDLDTAEIGFAYRLIGDSSGTGGLSVSLGPSLALPIGPKRSASSCPCLSLPLWFQQDVTSWSFFGGAGIALRADAAADWFGGLVATKQLSDRLALGVELYREASEEAGDASIEGLSLGLIYRLSRGIELGASATVEVERQSARHLSYRIAVGWTP